MKKFVVSCIFILSSTLTIVSCSDSSSSGGGEGSTTNSAFSGRLSSISASSFGTDGVSILSTKTITHVMAISPATSNGASYISAVASDGTFNLAVNSGKPYIIVFVSKDGVLTGPDMIVSTVRISSNDLDSLSIVNPTTVDLGTVTANSTTTNASISTSVPTLLASLGITSDEATFLGSADDLALRLANPDVDMNGEIDLLENKTFGLDWHVRADTRLSGSTLRLADVENSFANEANVSLNWTLASAYAIYPTSFDSGDYVVNSGVSTALQNGGALTITGSAISPTSVSGGAASNMTAWGPDYLMTGMNEIGGSDSAAVFTFTLGSPSKQLRYNNVRTKTKAQLNANGVLLPFVKINTAAGIITGLEYKWMKKSGSTWEAASATEVGLMVQESGAYLALYTARSPGSSTGLTFSIPSTSATGTINVGAEGSDSMGGISITNIALSSICNAALSYDDQMGLRLFAGAPLPASVTCP